jgi:ABC-type branched-subunit amino acid transport system ATPase component/ABC-type branched-subunit amino acid transport system permease subunit
VNRIWPSRRGRLIDPIPLLALVAFCAIPVFSGSASLQNAVTLAMIWTFWALSLNIIWGYAGQFSMAQVALGGLAAYSFALLASKSGMNQFLAIVVATAGTVIASVIVGLVCLRLEGFRFAIMTLAFALAGVGLAGGLTITGQSAGLTVPEHWATLSLGSLSWNLDGRLGGFTALMIVVFLILAAGLTVLLRTRPGRGMLAIREDDVLAESLGITTGLHRILAFGLSAAVASLAGVFQAEYYSYIYPDLFNFDTLVTVIVVLTLGGRGRLFGPLVGGAIYATLTNILNIGGRFQQTVFGVAVIVITIVARHGISYYLSRGERSLVALAADQVARDRLRAWFAQPSWRPRPAEVTAPELTSVSSGAAVTAPELTAAELTAAELTAAGQTAAGQTAAGHTVVADSVGGADLFPPSGAEELREARAAHSLAERGAPVVLEGIGLTKRYGGLVAVRDFSFQVHQGEILGLIGPNGAGKTTAFNLVSGFVRPDSGVLTWRGRPITRLSPHARARLGLVRTFQQPRVFPQLTIRENLVIAAQSHLGRVRRTDGSRPLPTADRVLEGFGMAHLADTPAEQLAYGYSKRLGVAMAVATGSEMLMLDEPAAGLNAADVDRLRADLVRLRDEGRTVWIVEHHMELVMAVCDRVLVMDAGSVIASGTPDEVMAHPQVLEAYLGGAA